MTGTHDWALVTMSVVIAVVASYTALDLAGRIRASTGLARTAWLGTAAVAMGGGIWAMHFVAMLALSMPGMAVGYDLGLTLVSLLAPIVVTGISFTLLTRMRASRTVLWLAGLCMGLSVVAMHYIGMAAMRMPATVRYDPAWVAISVGIAVAAATTALWLATLRSDLTTRLGAAVVMGAAISGMHFAGMRAATFVMICTPVDRITGTRMSPTSLALTVSTAALLILFLALIAAMFDRRFAQFAAREAAVLRRSEERFRALYRGTPLPLHALDDQGCIEQVSDAWLRLTGYARDDVIGRSIDRFLTPESRDQLRDADFPALLRDGVLLDREYRIVTRDGETCDVVASARVERDEDGGFVHIVGGLTDVTARNRAEQALRQAQKIESIGQLTGGIAHDFNNLLAVVIGNLDLLARQVPEGSRAARLVANAMAGATRGASLTQRLLAFARRQDLRPESVDIAALVDGLSDMLERTLGPQVRVETGFADPLPPAHVDAHQLELAILNMAVNARDAMPGGGTLSIRAGEDDAPDPALSGRFVRIDIADTGSGMDADTLARASEPFFTTKGVGKGTGLGLSMVQGLAVQSGGLLRIESAPDAGTTIRLWLPVADTPCAAAVATPDAVAIDCPPLSILVVDDDPLVLANTAAMLEDLGHRVAHASSGAEALATIERGEAVDLVVTDQMMPGMTGSQLATALKATRPDVPILLVSGFAELAVEDRLNFAILHKPFAQAALAQAVARTHAGAMA